MTHWNTYGGLFKIELNRYFTLAGKQIEVFVDVIVLLQVSVCDTLLRLMVVDVDMDELQIC